MGNTVVTLKAGFLFPHQILTFLFFQENPVNSTDIKMDGKIPIFSLILVKDSLAICDSFEEI